MTEQPTGLHTERCDPPTDLQALVDLAPDGIFIAGADGRLSYVNPTCCRLLDCTADEILGRSIEEFLPPDEIVRMLASRARWQPGARHAGVWTLRRKDGSCVPVEVNAAMRTDGGWQGYVRDISDRKAREVEREMLLQETEAARQWLQAVLDTLPLGVLLYAPDGALRFNRHAEQMLGMEVSAGLGSAQFADRICYPDGRRVPPEQLLSARVLREAKTIVAEEYLVAHPDGTQIPVLAGAAPIRDVEGGVIGLAVVLQNVAERMRLNDAIRKNERLLQSIVDILPVGLWIADTTGKLITSNPAAQRIWGGAHYVSREEYHRYKGWWVDTGKPIAPDEWGMARAIAGETSTGELIRIEGFDGSLKTIIHSAAPLRDDDGAIIGGIVVNEDVTAFHAAQEKQRASEHLLRTVFDLLPVGLLVTDRQGSIFLANPASEHIWAGVRYVGADRYGEYEGWWAETGQPIGSDEWGLARAIKTGETSRGELIKIRCFDGSFKTTINWAAPIRSDAGEIVGAVAVNEDVTTLQHNQEQLRAVVRDREELLAIVAHDLRNPLHTLLIGVEAAEDAARRLPGGDEIRRLFQPLVGSCERMSGLVDDLLAVAVGRGGRSMLDRKFVPASTLIARAADAARPVLAKALLQLDVEVPAELPLVNVDADRVLRVFSNLFDNALKYTPTPGRVEVRAKVTAGGVLFWMVNSGSPLPTSELAAMFQPFWQAMHDRRGTGLGLSISRSIVEAHGGSIWAEPVEGGRVRVCFVLPRPLGP